MKLFVCDTCGNRLYFENVSCTRCGATLGWLPGSMRLAALNPIGDGSWAAVGQNRPVRMCQNYSEQGVCNWMVDASDNNPFCLACRLNRTIPDLSVPGQRELWRVVEAEKRRLVYSLLRFGLPVTSQSDGLCFDFLADPPGGSYGRDRVTTGHRDGVITINVAEADPAWREQMRANMDEPYRTTLGHFRHESGHYYWQTLIRAGGRLSAWRDVFGDESQDYARSMQNHYDNGPPPGWQSRFVSGYASMHPWEDWAESWAHYLHIVDTQETAGQYGLKMESPSSDDHLSAVWRDLDPYGHDDFETIFECWLPLTYVLNSLNRSMGHGDAYPFVLSRPAIEKLAFVHQVIREASEERDES